MKKRSRITFFIVIGVLFSFNQAVAIEYFNLKQALKHPKDVTKLVLRDFGIAKKYQNKVFPAGIGEMENLEHIELKTNLIIGFPPEIANCKKLKTVILKDDFTFPDEIKSTNIESIEWIVSENKLDEFPIAICSIESLKKITIQDQNISLIPENIGQLVNLEHLNLSKNKITIIPSSFEKLKKLSVLNIQNNAIKELSNFLFYLPKLDKLNYLENPIQAESFVKISHSNPEKFHVFCSVDGEKNTFISDIIEAPSNVMMLSVYGQNNVKTFLKNADKFYSLIYLELGGDIVLTYEIDNLVKLKRLRTLIYSPQNGKIPAGIGKIHQIEHFEANLGEFSTIIPHVIYEMTQLKTLNFSAYNFKDIPKEILILTHLESLSLQGNFDSFPSFIARFSHLKKITIESENLTILPKEILEAKNINTITFNGYTQTK